MPIISLNGLDEAHQEPPPHSHPWPRSLFKLRLSPFSFVAGVLCLQACLWPCLQEGLRPPVVAYIWPCLLLLLSRLSGWTLDLLLAAFGTADGH